MQILDACAAKPRKNAATRKAGWVYGRPNTTSTTAAAAKTITIQRWVPSRRVADGVTSAASRPPSTLATMTWPSPAKPSPIAPSSV